MTGRSGKIGFWLSTSLVVGNMTGSGIFLLPAALALYGGISIFGWILTLVGSIFLALVFSRLSKLYTRTGGPYVYAREGFGAFGGFLVMWGYWNSIWCGNAAIAVAGVGYVSSFFPQFKDNHLLSAGLAIAAIWIFTAINTRSIRSVGMVQFITTLLKIIPLILMGTVGFIHFNSHHFSPFNLSDQSDFKAITSAGALVLWAFLGLESATIPSEQVNNPAKIIPRATVAGLLIAALIYISSTVAVMGIIDPATLQHSTAPYADAAGLAWTPLASKMVAAGAVIACFGALNGWILMMGKIPMAAARDGLFPKAFNRLNSQGVPVAGMMISSTLSSLLVMMNYTRGLVNMFSFFILLATFTCLVPYLFSSIAELMLYFKGKRPGTPRQWIMSVIVSIPAFLYVLWAFTGLSHSSVIWGSVLLSAGIPVYLFFRKREVIYNEPGAM